MTEAQTQPQTVVAFDEVKNLVGKSLGHSAWREITQEQVNTFADATDDHQWIHVDPERAAEGPFGAPIVHGFLTLSLLIPMWSELFDVTGVRTKVNYGLDKVRFTSPVKVGSRIRMTVTITDVQEVKGNGLHLVADGTIEIEGEERPAVVATFLNRFYA
ncbi:MaoC family dehydratase [Kocuria rosea]|uniref:MaoC family dehydratase n=1 Tax=Kocuria rosea TaxID=1275 RepID=A0A4R5YM29_KOCRO|nr:MaoC family dehydratase [Kocuria rosea]TDL44477.1 MaoC family dehydratase [Kocuria rosea]